MTQTIEAALAMIPRPDLAYLSEQEQRILLKTAFRLNQECAISRVAGMSYIKNLTPIQKEVVTKVATKSANAVELAAFRNFGFNV